MQTIYYTVMMYATIALLLTVILALIVIPAIKRWEYTRNEISMEEYQTLLNMAQNYPHLKSWLAEQLRERGQLTGNDYVKLKYQLRQLIKQYDHDAAKTAIQQSDILYGH